MPQDVHFAGSDLLYPDDGPHQGRLSTPRGPEQSYDLPGRDVHVDATEHPVAAADHLESADTRHDVLFIA